MRCPSRSASRSSSSAVSAVRHWAGRWIPHARLQHGRVLPDTFPWWGLLALATAAFTDVVTDLLPAGLLPQMSTALHVPEARVGLLVSAFAIASALAAIPVTALLRGLPRRPVLIGVLAGFALLNAVTAVSGWYPLTFAARLLAGVMGGTLWSMLAGYAARMVPARQRGRAIAVVLAGITVALSAGIPAGTALAGALGWRASFGLLAGLALLLTAWIRWQVPAFAGEPADRRAPLRRVARQPGIRAVLAVTVLLLTGHQAMYTYVAPFAPGRTSLVLLVFGGATVAGIWITGVVADRYLRPVLLAALGLIAVAMLVLGWRRGRRRRCWPPRRCGARRSAGRRRCCRPRWSTPRARPARTWRPPCRPRCTTSASPPGHWPAAWSWAAPGPPPSPG